MTYRIAGSSLLGVLALAWTGCATTAGRDGGVRQAHDERGLELAVAGEHDRALAEFTMALDESRADERRAGHATLHIAHAIMLQGDEELALASYRWYLEHYPDAPRWERSRVANEVRRIEAGMVRGDRRSRTSLAELHLSGHRNLIRAQEALGKRRYVEASRALDLAYQYLGDPALLLEAGLAATMADELERAATLLEAYKRNRALDLDATEARAIDAELSRIAGLLGGFDETEDGLAECVYTARGAPRFEVELVASSGVSLAADCL